jgi:hypothetical protein
MPDQVIPFRPKFADLTVIEPAEGVQVAPGQRIDHST